MKLKIVNLNMWWGGKYLWDKIVEYLKAEDPDIIFLQEVYHSTEPGLPKHLNAFDNLKSELGFPYAEFAEMFTMKNGDDYGLIGNAILSKYPLSVKHIGWLQGSGPVQANNDDRASIEFLPRNFMHCEVSTDSRPLNLIVTHGIWSPSGKEKPAHLHAAQILKEYTEKLPNLVLGGDFNIGEESESIQTLSSSLTNVFAGKRQTSFNLSRKNSEKYGHAVVDFFFTSSDIKVISAETADADVSDHQSQILEIEI